MVGLIYNTAVVTEELDSWSALWDPKYDGEILMFNNPRDAFGIAQFLLKEEGNDIEEALGDIVISIQKVEEQAKEYGHSFERELAYMYAKKYAFSQKASSFRCTKGNGSTCFCLTQLPILHY